MLRVQLLHTLLNLSFTIRKKSLLDVYIWKANTDSQTSAQAFRLFWVAPVGKKLLISNLMMQKKSCSKKVLLPFTRQTVYFTKSKLSKNYRIFDNKKPVCKLQQAFSLIACFKSIKLYIRIFRVFCKLFSHSCTPHSQLPPLTSSERNSKT